jgi:hypothetical protein
MKNQQSPEQTSLIESEKIVQSRQIVQSPIIYLKTAEYFLCLVVAFPSAVLNGLAAVSGDADKAGSLHTLSDLKNLLDDSSAGKIFYGVIALFASEAVLFFLNKRYLLASVNEAIHLLKRTRLTLQSFILRATLNPKESANLAENALFFLSILTSLIFAEMGSEALSFLGLAGQIIGFSLSLFVYFATRFASAKFFFDNLYDVDFQLKKAYKEKLELLNHKNIPSIEISSGKIVNDALIEFLANMDENWNTLPKNQKKIICLRYIAPILSYSLIAITLLPIMAGFLPSSIQGLELLTQESIGKNSDYQNPASFVLGIFITALTVFFYELSIKELPKHFLLTLLAIYEKIIEDKLTVATKLTGLTVFALGSSYFTSIGFKFIADTALTNGYLAYLGPSLSQVIPNGLFIGVITMLWSHLQELINQEVNYTQAFDVINLTHIDLLNAQALINHSDINLYPLARNKVALFSQDADEKSSVTDPLLKNSKKLGALRVDLFA